eukprot:augustus_masked-scaffold_2-processed-gene-17.50-mRNA-1 protein AED:0.01 eAED:0.01 QI:0/-1/0/1/-1/1/1/0/468
MLEKISDESALKQKLSSDELLKSYDIAVVYFWADIHDACIDGGPMDQLMRALSAKYGSDIKFYKADAMNMQNFAQECGVEMVPNFTMFHQGKKVSSYEGTSAEEIVGFLDKGIQRYAMSSANQSKNLSAHEKAIKQLEEEEYNYRLKSLINQAKVMVFMKGTPSEPKCKFSRELMEILSGENISFGSFNILEDQSVREKLKVYSNWKTYPQVYLNGQLLGGLDSVKEYMKQGPGALSKKLSEDVSITDAPIPKISRPPPTPVALEDRLKQLINRGAVMLFMKGEPEAPQCGFSNKMVALLNENGIKFSSFDILSDEEVRQGLKKYSDWPTYPQLYVKGELVGGLDILQEMVNEEESLKDQLGIGGVSLEDKLRSLINKDKIMLFMKGDPEEPRCGFSRTMVGILHEVCAKFSTFDILSDEEIRQGLKSYSDWPTYPQLYVNGELIGGLDIIKELKEEDELLDALDMSD